MIEPGDAPRESPDDGGGGGGATWRGFLHQLNLACGAHVPKIPVKRTPPPGLVDLLDTYGVAYVLRVYAEYAQLCAGDAEQRAFWSPARLFREGVFSVADRLVSEPEVSAKGEGAGGGSKASHGRRGGRQEPRLPLVPRPLADEGSGPSGDDPDADEAADELLRTADRMAANVNTQA